MMKTLVSNSTYRSALAVPRGFSLLEILVALLVLSVGLLGLAGLQLNGLRSNQDSYNLSQAMAQAYDMADRMRANMTGIAAYATNSTVIPSDPGCITGGCSSPQLAQYDLFQWNTANANLLPSGKGLVSVSGNIYTITVMWDQFRTGANGTGCLGGPTDLTCYTTSFQP